MQHLFHFKLLQPKMTSSSQPEINIRPLRTHEELDGAVSLQRSVWGYLDLEVDSRSMLTVASRFAGQTLGAFDQDRLIGFSLAFATLPVGRLHSHRVGVHPDYQNLGVGRKLKLAQRADAIARGIGTIQWTFDPLQSRNAYFNIVRLGGIARTYIPNLYGITTSPLHGGLPTDRLLIEWNLQSNRVNQILAGEPIVHCNDSLEIRLPPPIGRTDSTAQAALREQFVDYFSKGYVACGFRKEIDTHIYVLEKL
jgi:predicted GNAT superfamily acetyltransferase